jgi:hypothetical protein
MRRTTRWPAEHRTRCREHFRRQGDGLRAVKVDIDEPVRGFAHFDADIVLGLEVDQPVVLRRPVKVDGFLGARLEWYDTPAPFVILNGGEQCDVSPRLSIPGQHAIDLVARDLTFVRVWRLQHCHEKL